MALNDSGFSEDSCPFPRNKAEARPCHLEETLPESGLI